MTENANDVANGLRADIAKLRGLAAGTREMEAVAQILIRIDTAVSEIERRVGSLESALPQPLPPPPNVLPMVSQPNA